MCRQTLRSVESSITVRIAHARPWPGKVGDRRVLIVGYLVVLTVAWIISVLEAFMTYRYFVFRVRGKFFLDLSRFSLVYSKRALRWRHASRPA